ncbi:MAG: hypothetical protein ACE5Q3_11940 [Alphaproteobacteria bacterium]
MSRRVVAGAVAALLGAAGAGTLLWVGVVQRFRHPAYTETQLFLAYWPEVVAGIALFACRVLARAGAVSEARRAAEDRALDAATALARKIQAAAAKDPAFRTWLQSDDPQAVWGRGLIARVKAYEAAADADDGAGSGTP